MTDSKVLKFDAHKKAGAIQRRVSLRAKKSASGGLATASSIPASTKALRAPRKCKTSSGGPQQLSLPFHRQALLPGIFETTPFSGRLNMERSNFLRPMHPKTEIRADRAAVEKVLDAGWIGQLKMHGHRAQIHIPADLKEDPIAYNRQGQPHQKFLPEPVIQELRRLFQPKSGWNVIDAEWLKPLDKLFVFDFLKKDGQVLNRMSYPERWALLPRTYISPMISTLPMLSDVEKCVAVLKKPPLHCEGLVFKSGTTKGFEDTSIVRCRIPGSLHKP